MTAPELSRRKFLAACLAGVSTSGSAAGAQVRTPGPAPRRHAPDATERIARMGARLRQRFRDVARHFLFEYYPWYGTAPWRHWGDAGRIPPDDIAASSLPLLGAYDSRAAHVLEQHARWIAQSGVRAINLSWWGRGGYEDESTHLVMDVMRAFGIKVAFHLEPYSGERGIRYADDVLYLLREYGERRRWDAFLLMENADGTASPVFKTFVTLLSPTETDCRGVTRPVDIYVPDDVWQRQVARVRGEVAADFEHIMLVADSLDAERTARAGFDACAIGNPYIRPGQWPAFTNPFDRRGIPFSFAVNAGFDAIEPRTPPSDPCYRPAPFEPPADVHWSSEVSRERAHQLSAARIEASLLRTLEHQTDPQSANWRRGVFLVYVNSFNEWHEGTAFEPMKSYRDMSARERLLYHNPVAGSYRLSTLQRLMELVE